MMGSTGKWHRRKIILSNGILEVRTVRSVVKERFILFFLFLGHFFFVFISQLIFFFFCRLPLGGCTVRMMEVSDRQNSFRLSNSSQLVVLAAESK